MIDERHFYYRSDLVKATTRSLNVIEKSRLKNKVVFAKHSKHVLEAARLTVVDSSIAGGQSLEGDLIGFDVPRDQWKKP